MIASRIQIKNFRSIGPAGVDIPLNKVTALIGQNSSGKSNIQHALDIFRNYKKSRVSAALFHKGDLTKPILISVTFSDLSPEEVKLFRRHLAADLSLTIDQEIRYMPTTEGGGSEASDEEEEGVGFKEEKTASLVKSGIEWLDEPPSTQAKIKTLWSNATLSVGGVDFKSWSELPADKPPAKEELETKIKSFWIEKWSNIPKELSQTGTKPLGWPSKFMGNLPPVVYIPAIKRFSEEAKGTQSSPFGALIKWFMESISLEIKESIQKKLDKVYEDAISSLPKEPNGPNGEMVSRLDLINSTLNRYLPRDFGARLEVSYKRPEVDRTIFGETGVNADDGFLSDIEHKGHGLQRSAILAVIRAYLELRSKLDSKAKSLGRVIFAIEEPELFLHPTVKRTTYKLFRTIAKNGDQVIYSTHDSNFLEIKHFEEIRVCQKSNEPTSETKVSHLPEDRLTKVWNELCGRTDIVIESIRARLQNAYDPLCNEGFLAKKVILVEGETEAATLADYFAAIGFDLDDVGCALIQAGSVDLIEVFHVIFTEFGIPVFIIWDGDHPNASRIDEVPTEKREDVKKKSKRNLLLAKLAGLQEFADKSFAFPSADSIGERGAVFKSNFEGSQHLTVTDYEVIKGEATRLYGTKSKPLCARYFCDVILKRGEAEGDRSKYVPQVLKDIAEKVKTVVVSPKTQLTTSS